MMPQLDSVDTNKLYAHTRAQGRAQRLWAAYLDPSPKRERKGILGRFLALVDRKVKLKGLLHS